MNHSRSCGNNYATLLKFNNMAKAIYDFDIDISLTKKTVTFFITNIGKS